MSFNNKFAVALLATAALMTGLHAMRVPMPGPEGAIQLAQVFVMPEMVLGALWGSGVTLVVQFYFRKAPSETTAAAMSKT